MTTLKTSWEGKMTRVQRTCRRIALFGLFSAFLVSVPKTIDSLDHRGLAEKVVFKVHKMSPPFAAFEDSHIVPARKEKPDGWIDDDASLLDKNDSVLVAGESFDFQKLKQAAEPMDLQEREGRLLAGMTFKRPRTHKLSQPTVRNVQGINEIARVELNREPKIYTSQGELMPLEERKNILAAHFADAFEGSTQKEVDEKNLRQKLIARKVEEMKRDEQVRHITSATGNAIIVKKVNKEAHAAKAPKRSIFSATRAPSAPRVTPEFAGRAQKTMDRARQIARVEPPSTAATVMETPFQDEPSDRRDYSYVIRGDIEMKDGLAYTGVDTFLRVVHVQGGYLQNEGVVWASEAEFEIVVDSMEGYLIGELRSSDGELLGYSEVGLSKITLPNKNDLAIEGVHLAISSAPKGLMVEVKSARSFEGNEINVSNAEVVIDSLERRVPEGKNKGEYSDESLTASSSFILKAQKEGYWNSIGIREARAHEKVVLFPDSMMEALISLSVKNSQPDREDQYGVVWGRVLDGGRPINGARVEMVGDGYVGPIYFTGFLPDRQRDKTSKNGLFAFVRVSPGIQSIQVHLPGKQFLAEVFPVASKSVSQIDVKSLRKRDVSVSLYDGFTGEPRPGKIQVIGSSREVLVESVSRKDIVLPGGSGVMIIEADGGKNYEVSRITTNKTAYHINFPFISSSWIRRIARQAGLSVNPQYGKVVGFHSENVRDVFIDEGHGTNSSQLIYFDRKGQLVPADRSQESAGFLFINVPVGYRTLTAHQPDTGVTSTQVIITAPGAVNIATFQD